VTALLAVNGIGKSFRGLRAVSNVSFELPEGSITALIGPNGAGKTTIFNLIAGALRPDTGTIVFQSRQIQGLRPDQVCAAGIGRTFQLVKPFAGLTVLENVTVGALLRERSASRARALALQTLESFALEGKAHLPASALTLPDRKRLEVARALATRPRLLLLDEVMAGLGPTETDRMVEALRALNRASGTTILLIEHVMRAVMALAHDVGVLHQGQLIARGRPPEIVRHPAVLDCYLGEEIEV
jgi:branched-chain amino acid transport system ATP-binding protein